MEYKELLKLKYYEFYEFTSTFKDVECNGVIEKIETIDGFYFRLWSNCEKFNKNEDTITPYAFEGSQYKSYIASIYNRSWRVAESNFSVFQDFKIIKKIVL